MTDSPAYRHGGPGAGWYLRTMGGWRRVSDTEAANERYEAMRHFMHDPRTVTDMPAEPIPWSHTISGDDQVVVRTSAEVAAVSYRGEPMTETEPGIWMADGTGEAEA